MRKVSRSRISPAPLRTPSRAMGMQTAGVTQLAGASGCAEVSQKALACAWCPTPIPRPPLVDPTPRRGCFGTLDRSSFSFRAFLTRPFPPRRRRRARREQGEDVRRAVQGVQGVPESRERGDCPSKTREQEGDVLGLNEESSMCRVTEKCVPRKRRSVRATSAGTPPTRYPRRRTSPPRTPARPCPPPRPR